ncbi:MAG: DNA polymerase III subunit alpha, partial [Halanaerobium sp. MSAO_Bac5]
ESRAALLINYEELYQKYNNLSRQRAQGQRSFAELFAEEDKFIEEDLKYEDIKELPTETILKQEKEYLGIYLSAHPLDNYQQKIQKLNILDISEVIKISENKKAFTAGNIVSYKEHITKRNNKMAFLTISDHNDKIEIIVFADLFKNINFMLSEQNAIAVYGRKSDGQLIAENILSLDNNFLIIDISQLKKKKIIALKKYLSKKEGDVTVLLKKDNKMIITDSAFNLSKNSRTIKELTKALGSSAFEFLA